MEHGLDRISLWMSVALQLAAEAGQAGEIPVGAVVVDADGRLIAEGRNATGRSRIEGSGTKADPTAHAEIVALRAAAERLGTSRLDGCTLVVTLEPCVMCAGAALQSRVSRIVFGAWDEKAGAVGGRLDVVREAGLPHTVEVVAGIREAEAALLLRRFFDERR